jgi:hypothetical protein
MQPSESTSPANPCAALLGACAARKLDPASLSTARMH